MKKILLATALLATSVSVIADDFVIATGSEGGGYERLGYKIAKSVEKQTTKKKIDMDFEVINTTGSVENLELFDDGDVQVAIVQGDSLSLFPPKKAYKSKNAHTEMVYWFANKANGVDDLEDLEGDPKQLVVIVEGSGASVTWQNFAKEDSGYKVNVEKGTIYAEDLYEAFELVSEGTYEGKKVAGLIHVTRAGALSTELREDFSKTVAIGEATDSDFADADDENGNPLYTTCEVERRAKAGWGTMSMGDPDTVCMKAKVIFTTEWDKKKTKRAVSKGVTKAVK